MKGTGMTILTIIAVSTVFSLGFLLGVAVGVHKKGIG